MKNLLLKKIVLGFIVCATIISSVSCSSKNDIKEIEGKDGLFAVINTDKGQIVLDLFYDKTPMTVTNFVGLAEGTLDAANGKPFYDGLKFHRVIADFMIQGGDPRGNGTGGPGYSFPDEFVQGLEFDKPGKLAMANSGPNTNGSQFFITHVPTEWLNNKHTIFGEVVVGQDVVNAIQQDDVIKSVKIIRHGDDAKKFEATQENFDELIKNSAKREEPRQAALLESAIEGCEKTEDGIYYKVLKEGTGEPCGKRQAVGVEYVGYLVDGTLFDATTGMYEMGHEPVYFVTGAGQMIPGFDLMIQDMKLGEVRKIVLPPEMGYGPQGYPGVIPPNSYICFDVELFKF